MTGFQVTPVVGIIPPNLPWRASEDEVSAVFEMPLAQALQLGRYHPLDVTVAAIRTAYGSPGMSIISSGA